MELCVDDMSVPVLWGLGLPAACPNVQKLKLSCSKDVTSNSIKKMAYSYWNLTEFQLEVMGRYRPWPSIEDTASFCKALLSSCPQLVSLSLIDLALGNIKTGDILRSMMAHKHLNSITYVQ